jgi:hypothetical protein
VNQNFYHSFDKSIATVEIIWMSTGLEEKTPINPGWGLSHDTIMAWLLSPAVLVTICAPILIDTSLWFFLAASPGGDYAQLARTPSVCALLEHRTQLYTMLIAFAFCTMQIFAPGAGDIAQNRQEIRQSKFRLKHTIFAVLVVCVTFAIFGGHLMSETVVGLYKAGACEQGVASPLQMPPLTSPVTWLRVFILVVAFFTALSESRRAPQSP